MVATIPFSLLRLLLVVGALIGVGILRFPATTAFTTSYSSSRAALALSPNQAASAASTLATGLQAPRREEFPPTILCSVRAPEDQQDQQIKPKDDTAASNGVEKDDHDGDGEKRTLFLPKGPSFLEALFGIAIDGSPWEYMLTMKRKGYDGIIPVDLKFAGKYNFLLSPESVKAATVQESKLLPRRFSVALFETLELDRGIVYEQGERHKRNKKICLPSFEQAQSMESFVEATKTELDGLSEEFKAKADSVNSKSGDEKSNNIDLYAEMRRSALNVVLDVSFGLGKEAAANFEKADELSETIAEYLERIVALANEIPPLWQISPRLSYNYVRVTDVVLPKLRALVSEVIEARRAEGAEAQAKRNRADLLGVLVEQLEDNADIRSILFDVVIAGSDTTASTATAATYVLHQPQHKKWLEMARAEAIAANAGRDTLLENLRTELPICVAVAREILRLYPPVPFVGRTATKTGSLMETYPVEPDDTFCFSPWYLGRDPSEWGENAAEFDPQRWLDDSRNGGAASSFSWLPFGAGSRGCLGTRLGLTEVVLGIARLLQDFDFEFETTGPLPVKYDLTLNLDGVMFCTIRNRHQTGDATAKHGTAAHY